MSHVRTALVTSLIGLAASVAGGQILPDLNQTPIWNYYQIAVGDHQPQYRFAITQLAGTSADLYLRKGAPPTRFVYDAISRRRNTSNESIILNHESRPLLTSGVWWVGVRRTQGTVVATSFTPQLIPSKRVGMGAETYDDGWPQSSRGTTFRVWVPNASAVHVAGDFNNWNGSTAPMASESGGHWSLDYRNVLPGAKYQYVITNGTQSLWRNDPRARDVTSSTGDSVVVDPNAYTWTSTSFTMPPWNELVIYEMHVGAFHDTPGGAPGTFTTAGQKVQYLADLGVNAVELMPVGEFAGDFSWGYNYGHPFAPESAYGSPEQLKTFIDACHARGIAVILDVLNNHWGPTDLDLWNFDGWSVSPWGGIYFYNDWRAQTPWGDTRPDYGRPEVRQYIHDNAMYWLNEYRIDGLRWDSTSYMRRVNGTDIPEAWSLMQWANDVIDTQQGWKIQIAEDMWSSSWITRPTGAGGAGFDTQWDPNFVHPMRAVLEEQNDNNRDMWAVQGAITYAYNSQAMQRVIYTESHDEVANGRTRLPEAIWPGNAASYFSKKRSTLGAALVLTSPGIPMLFMGQEFLEDGYFHDDDPLDWSKATTHAGIVTMYRDLIRLRRNWYNETAGLRGDHTNVFHVNNTDKVVAFHRWQNGGPGDDVVVIANFRNQGWNNYTIGLPAPGTWNVRFNSDSAIYDSSFGSHPSYSVTAQNIPYDGLPYSASVSFGPYSVVILSR